MIIIMNECRRILSKKVLILFLLLILGISGSSTYAAVQNYDIRDSTGIVMPWYENLSLARQDRSGTFMDADYMTDLQKKGSVRDTLAYSNLDDLVRTNYMGRHLKDLSSSEISAFYSQRLAVIKKTMETDESIRYTGREVAKYMEQAGKLLYIPVEYAEGWKVLTNNMGKYVALILVMIALLLIPLFGEDDQTNMKEICKSTKHGTIKLDHSKIITAYLMGIILYFIALAVYLLITLVPFGFGGADQIIQSSTIYFFSIYNITFIQQFLVNALIGFCALLFMISFATFVSVISENIIVGSAVVVFFWILLLIFDQVRRFPVDHWFANFMPLRMTDFSHYYYEYEIYRAFGSTFTCMRWAVFISVISSVAFMILSVFALYVKRSSGKIMMRKV